MIKSMLKSASDVYTPNRLTSYFTCSPQSALSLPGCVLSLLLLVLSPAPVSRAQSQDSTAHQIRRFQMVAQDFYRGGQPKERDFVYLQQRGIKTIINLRKENDEQPIIEKLGMKYVHIPLSAWRRVPDSAIETFIQILKDPTNYPIFIHCQRGADRTGVMVGFYRIAFQGWEAKRAYQEARQIGMRWWYRGLKNQLYEFAEKYHKATQAKGS